MVYYAYAKTSADDWSTRYLIVAATINDLDDWYNTVIQKHPGEVLVRVTDDFFVFDRSKFNLGRSTMKGAVGEKFMNKMMFQLLSDNEGRNMPTFVNAVVQGR